GGLSTLTTCVQNVIQSAASGTVNAATGDVSITLALSSRVYVTGNSASPCPKCLSGICDPSWKTNTSQPSPDSGHPCTAVGTLFTSNDCRPALSGLQPSLPINLIPLTTGTTSMTNGTGVFCPGQVSAGAFGQPARCITETGQAAGNITDQMP